MRGYRDTAPCMSTLVDHDLYYMLVKTRGHGIGSEMPGLLRTSIQASRCHLTGIIQLP